MKHRKFIFLNLLSFGLIIFVICNFVFADCIFPPDQMSIVEDSTRAVFDTDSLSIDIPNYCEPVDIYFAIFNSAGDLYFVNFNGNLTRDFIPYAINNTSAIQMPVSLNSSQLASEIIGECALYWLIAPTNGGDILQTLNTGIYELGVNVFSNEQQEDGPDIVLAIPTDVDKIILAWLPIDDVEAYEIHMSTSDVFPPDDSTLYKTVGDTNQIDITNLESETTYYFIILARTNLGEIISGRNYVSATPFASPLVRTDNIVVTSDELNLGEHVQNGDQLIYPYSQTATIPEVGSIIASQGSNETGVLRRVDNVTTNDSEIIIDTSTASLADVFEQGTVSTTVKLFDVDAVTRSNAAKSRLDVKRTTNKMINQLSWKDNLLVAKQTDYIHDDNEISIIPDVDTNKFNIKRSLSKSVSEKVTIDAHVDFSPEIETEIKWSGLRNTNIERAKLIARGTLSLGIDASYDFDAKGKYLLEDKVLFSRTLPVRYIIGGVPVWQTIILTVKANISASAWTKILASTHASISERVEIGLEYDKNTGWKLISEHNEASSVTADISINGGVTAHIELVPKVEVKFYSTIAASIELEPSIDAAVRCDSISSSEVILQYLTPRVLQPTTFYINWGVKAYLSADLEMFHFHLPIFNRSNVFNTGDIPLMSLPRMCLSPSSDNYDYPMVFEKNMYELKLTNGINNNWNIDSISWNVIPEKSENNAHLLELGCVAEDDGYTCKAEVSADKPGGYSIVVSGYGAIGEGARQYDIAGEYFTDRCSIDDYYDNGEYCEYWDRYYDEFTYKRMGLYSRDLGTNTEIPGEAGLTYELIRHLHRNWAEYEIERKWNQNNGNKLLIRTQNDEILDTTGIQWADDSPTSWIQEVFYLEYDDQGHSIVNVECNRDYPWEWSYNEDVWEQCLENVSQAGAIFSSESPIDMSDCSWWNHEDPQTGEWVTCEE